MKAVLSQLNLDPLRAVDRSETLFFAGYNQLIPTLRDPASGAHGPDLEAALVFLDGETILGADLFELPTPAGQAGALARLDELLAAISDYARRVAPVPVVVSTVLLPPERFLRFLEANSSFSFGDWQTALNQRIRASRETDRNVLILDWERCVADHGYRNLYDDRFFYLARVKLNQRAMEILHRELSGLLRAHRGQARKVLCLDLDNTLWGGVVGEDGLAGVALSEDGVGKAYRDFQRALRALRQLGVLLVINSKNNVADVDEMFSRHPMMVLAGEDFVARRINWEDKASNLRSLAAELGLGLDAFVALDDSPVERALLQKELPEVACPDFPQDPALLRCWLLRELVPAYFGRVSLTAEDQQRTAQYAARAQRAAIAPADPREFVKSLGIALDVRFNDPDQRARVAQLTQKTNQFNMTTRRSTEAEIDALLRDDRADVVTVGYQDRFGQEGVVGVALVSYRDARASVDTLLLSCRVIGRRVEHQLLLAVARRARERGCQFISAEFLPTPKNLAAADFYAEAGLVRAGTSLYELSVDALITSLEKQVQPA